MAYKVNYTVIGDVVRKGGPFPTVGKGAVRMQTFLQTTNATPTTLVTIPVPNLLSSPSVLTVMPNIVAIQNDGSKGAYGISALTSAWFNGGGTSFVGAPSDFTFITSTSFSVSAIFNLSGSNLIISVTGLAATTINWVSDCNCSTNVI